MKTVQTQMIWLFCGFFLIYTTITTAQNAQAYAIHLDYVYPSKVVSYETLAKKLAGLAKENKEESGWLTFVTDDYRYHYMTAIENMADMDKDFMPNVRKTLGNEKYGELFNEFDNYYDHHTDYILNLSANLSYMPEGLTLTPEGKNYRRQAKFYFKPRDRAKVVEIFKSYKELYAKKGSKMHYRIYLSGFGNDESYVMASFAAQNALDYAKMASERNQLLGDENNNLYNELEKYITKVERISGNIRMDLSYIPAK